MTFRWFGDRLIAGEKGRFKFLYTKQRVNIFLDGAVIQHFKSEAGDRGCQTSINEALKQSIQAETFDGVVRKTIREELRRA